MVFYRDFDGALKGLIRPLGAGIIRRPYEALKGLTRLVRLL